LVRKTADTDDPNIRVAALARLAEGKDARAIDQLERFSQPGSPVAQAARLALANAGDRRVQLWIEQDLAAEAPERRLAAATALAAMGVAARAAGLLADADPRVRMRAACTILVAARRCH
jgi:HEAT repeat protein